MEPHRGLAEAALELTSEPCQHSMGAGAAAGA